MNIEEYISFRYPGQQPQGELQYQTSHPQAYYQESQAELRTELWRYLHRGFFAEERPSRRLRFLDFHLQAYPEDKRDFVYFVKQSPRLIPDEVLDIYFRLYFEPQLNGMVEEWLQEMGKTAEPLAGASKASVTTPKQVDGAVPSDRPTRQPRPGEHRVVVLDREEMVHESVIREWFERELLHKTFKGKPIISAADLDMFLRAGFASFEEAAFIPKEGKLVVNANGAFLKHVMHRFYHEFRRGEKDGELKQGLVKLLKSTFSTFEKSEVGTIASSMHRLYKPEN